MILTWLPGLGVLGLRFLSFVFENQPVLALRRDLSIPKNSVDQSHANFPSAASMKSQKIGV